MSIKEYKPGTRFPGVIGRTPDVSQPAWPEPNRAKERAPNVLFIVLDDTGFGHLGCYGSPIETPNIDALAADGIRYNNMHTTALCSPSRACILTGRNHHSNHLAASPMARRDTRDPMAIFRLKTGSSRRYFSSAVTTLIAWESGTWPRKKQ